MKRLDDLGVSPAPWKVGEDYDYCFVFDGKEERAICAIQWAGTRDENGHSEDSAKRANARLIAAAPDMYEALRLVLETIDALGFKPVVESDPLAVAVKCGEAALEKAGGKE